MNSTVFWDATPCSFAHGGQSFGGTNCLHLQESRRHLRWRQLVATKLPSNTYQTHINVTTSVRTSIPAYELPNCLLGVNHMSDEGWNPLPSRRADCLGLWKISGGGWVWVTEEYGAMVGRWLSEEYQRNSLRTRIAIPLCPPRKINWRRPE